MRINRINGEFHTKHTYAPYCPACGYEFEPLYFQIHMCQHCGARVVVCSEPVQYSTYLEPVEVRDE